MSPKFVPFVPTKRFLIEEAHANQRINAISDDPTIVALIGTDVVVEPAPAERFRPPTFLVKTADSAMGAELASLFAEIREVHEENVGETYLEVVAYYGVTGLNCALEERIRIWADRYFRSRIAKLYPPDAAAYGDPFVVFEKLVRENESIFAPLGRDETTVGPICLGLTLQYVPWLLFRLLWSKYVVSTPLGRQLRYRPSRADIPVRIEQLLNERCWGVDRIGPFLHRLDAALPSAEKAAVAHMSDAELRECLAAMAQDCQEMRPFLRCNYQSHKSAVRLADDLMVAWEWSTRQGIAYLMTAKTDEDLYVNARLLRSADAMSIGYDGIIFDWNLPWLKALGHPANGTSRPLVLNYCLLQRLHAKLFSFFDRIDLNAIRSPPRPPERPSGDDAFVHEEPGELRRIPGLRLERLLTILIQCFGCEVRTGKGSEIVIRGPGSRIYAVGRHKGDDSIPPQTIRRMLRRLEILVADWLDVVDKT